VSGLLLVAAAAVWGERERVQVDLAAVAVPQRDGDRRLVAEHGVAVGRSLVTSRSAGRPRPAAVDPANDALRGEQIQPSAAN
jgi:hypothetical protein